MPIIKIISKALKAFLIVFTSIIWSDLLANPQGGVIAAGAASVTQAANTTTINQSSSHVIINWQSFNIQNGEITQFQQPKNGIALNRVNSALGPSQILGALNANGKIFIVNQAGIVFGPNAAVNVGGIIVSTSNISNSNFLAGNYVFDEPSSFANAAIINNGSIKAAHYGLVALLSENVVNNGVIKAHLGNIILASGSKFTIDFNGDELINFTVDAPAKGSIINNGKLQSNGGNIIAIAQVDLSGSTASSILDNSIQMNGILIADTVEMKNGEVILSSNAGVDIGGQVYVAGWLPDQLSGGVIKINANTIKLEKTSLLLVDGNQGGGSITLEGINDPISGPKNAAKIELVPNSKITLNALQGGTGGSLSIAGDQVIIEGNIFANSQQAGALGFGGSINIQGEKINLSKSANVSANGTTGGGLIAIGGNPYSLNENKNSANVTMDALANITAMGLEVGAQGGLVSIQGDYLFLNSKIDVSATHANASGGILALDGHYITVGTNAILLANGDLSGGQVNIGSNPFNTSESDTISLNILQGSRLEAKSIGTDPFALSHVGGTVFIFATNTFIDSKLDASSTAFDSQGEGGRVLLFGKNIILTDNAAIDVRGSKNGGYIQLGADQDNTGLFPNPPFITPHAKIIEISDHAILDASSINNGDGGVVKIWADNTVNFYGKILARGGINGGNGGEISIDGIKHLNNYGVLDVSAPNGSPGIIKGGINH